MVPDRRHDDETFSRMGGESSENQLKLALQSTTALAMQYLAFRRAHHGHMQCFANNTSPACRQPGHLFSPEQARQGT